MGEPRCHHHLEATSQVPPCSGPRVALTCCKSLVVLNQRPSGGGASRGVSSRDMHMEAKLPALGGGCQPRRRRTPVASLGLLHPGVRHQFSTSKASSEQARRATRRGALSGALVTIGWSLLGSSRVRTAFARAREYISPPFNPPSAGYLGNLIISPVSVSG